MDLQKKDIVVLIPCYKAMLTNGEAASLRQCSKVLSAYKRILVCPTSLDTSTYIAIDSGLQIQRFDDSYFANIKGYNQLLLSVGFYKQFIDYQYFLIYQLDAWVFKDALLEWCQKGYDYVGAPWVTVPPSNPKSVINLSKLLLNKVGNGGFCIRSCKKHYYTALLLRPISWLFAKNEDFFWCYIVPKLNPFYHLPTMEVALDFAFELDPSRCLRLNDGQLPFGCHAWEKHEPEFWKKYIVI